MADSFPPPDADPAASAEPTAGNDADEPRWEDALRWAEEPRDLDRIFGSGHESVPEVEPLWAPPVAERAAETTVDADAAVGPGSETEVETAIESEATPTEPSSWTTPVPDRAPLWQPPKRTIEPVARTSAVNTSAVAPTDPVADEPEVASTVAESKPASLAVNWAPSTERASTERASQRRHFNDAPSNVSEPEPNWDPRPPLPQPDRRLMPSSTARDAEGGAISRIVPPAEPLAPTPTDVSSSASPVAGFFQRSTAKPEPEQSSPVKWKTPSTAAAQLPVIEAPPIQRVAPRPQPKPASRQSQLRQSQSRQATGSPSAPASQRTAPARPDTAVARPRATVVERATATATTRPPTAPILAPKGQLELQPRATRVPPVEQVASNDRTVIIAAFALALLGGLFADSAPTGLGAWDMMLRMLLAGAVTLLLSRARRWVWIVVTAVATAFGGLSLAGLFGGLGLLVATLSVLSPKRDRAAGAIVGALLAQSLLRFPALGFFGLPSLVAGVLVAMTVWYGYDASDAVARSRMRIVGWVMLILTVLCSCAAAAAIASVYTDTQRGVTAARDGVNALTEGNAAQTVLALETTEQALRRSSRRLSSPWARPGRLVPVVGQHLAALGQASRQGEILAAAAGTVVDSSDFEALSLSQGQLDLTEVRSLSSDLAVTAKLLGDTNRRLAAAQSPWLLPPLDDRLTDLSAALTEAIPQADLASEAADVVPALLGESGPRRYFVIFGSPAESRELGGFVGSYALIEANDGQLSVLESDRSIALYEAARAGALDHPDGYPNLFNDMTPAYWPQNLTGLPTISEVRRAVIDVFPDYGGAPIDGVLYLDPYAIAALLEITGPIAVEGVDEPMAADYVTDFLFEDQYVWFATGRERFDYLGRVLQATFAALIVTDLPGPTELGRILGPVAREGRIQLATGDDAENEFLERVFLHRSFPEPAGDDFLSVVQANGAPNKLDVYLQREVIYDVDVRDDGELRATAKVLLTSAPPDFLPSYVMGNEAIDDVGPGESRVILSIYTPHSIEEMRIDGQVELPGAHDEYGYWRYVRDVIVRPNETVAVEFDLIGRIEDPDRYQLIYATQPLVNRDTLDLDIVVNDGDPITFSGEIAENTAFSLTSGP